MICTSRKLERALARGDVAGWNAARYYYVPMIVITVFSAPVWLIRPRYSIFPKPTIMLIQFLLHVLAGLLVYHGMKKCFQTNEQIDARDFIHRMVILGFPVFIKVVTLTLTASLVLLHLALRIDPSLHPTMVVTTLSPIMTFVTFMLMNESLKRFGAERGKSQQAPACDPQHAIELA